jgi:hypothetical protein
MDMDSPQEMPVRRVRRSRVRFYFMKYGLLVGLVLLVVVGVGAYLVGRASVYSQNPQLSQQNQAQAVLEKVGKLIQLPQNETPNMAEIVDAAAAAKDQPFVADAQNGDILIVYSQAGTAILYRPSTDKLIAVGPVSSGSTQTVPPPAASTISPSSDSSSSDTASKKDASTTITNATTKIK